MWAKISTSDPVSRVLSTWPHVSQNFGLWSGGSSLPTWLRVSRNLGLRSGGRSLPTWPHVSQNLSLFSGGRSLVRVLKGLFIFHHSQLLCVKYGVGIRINCRLAVYLKNINWSTVLRAWPINNFFLLLEDKSFTTQTTFLLSNYYFKVFDHQKKTFFTRKLVRCPAFRIRDILAQIRIHGSVPLTNGSGLGSRGLMTNNWEKRYRYSWQSFNLFLDQKLQFTYPYVSIKDIQATGEAFGPKKTPSNSKRKFINCIVFFWVIFAPLDPDPQHCIVHLLTDGKCSQWVAKI